MPSDTTVCAEAGCTRTDLKAKGLCGLHYDRQRAAKINATKPPRIRQMDQPCSVEGCEKLVGAGSARGYCSTHARAFYAGRLGKAPKPDPYPVAECPICHQERRLDRNHPKTRQRVCQSCYRGRVEPAERKKPGPKPKTYGERPGCVQGHLYEEGSFKQDTEGRRVCLICLENRRKTRCPRGHPYDEANTFLVNGSPQCKICRNERMRLRRNLGVGQGGVNAAKTHCPHGHEYSSENTLLSTDGRRSCRACARLNAVKQNLKRMGLTEERFEAMLAAQEERCSICAKDLAKAGVNIDHDHSCCGGPFSCGRCVRALLCSACNHMLGNAEDDPARLRAAADYIDRYRSS